ncbi:MAG TPA: hypothetical protein DCO77_06560 [Nitrospiraceae bacterium]|nr:hypothetical protein [Nitrospiraceae bacterium]
MLSQPVLPKRKLVDFFISPYYHHIEHFRGGCILKRLSTTLFQRGGLSCSRLLASMTMFFVCLFWATPARCAGASAADTLDQSPPASFLTGTFSTHYRYRTTRLSGDQVNDHDLLEQLRIDYATPRESTYEIHFLATSAQDLDGDQDHRDFFPFEDISDARDTWWSGYLYEAHVDMNYLLPALTQLRIGRQSGTRDEPVFFDGIAADMAVTRRLNLTVYGGTAVHFHELDDDWGSDTLAGAGLDYFPFRKTRLSVDYLYARDKRESALATDQEDDLTSIKIRQHFSPFLRAMAALRHVNGESRDVKARAIKAFPSMDMEFNLTYFRQFRTQNELSNELASYYDVLGQSDPFQSIDVKIRKFLGPRFAIDLGYFARELINNQVESAFNREYQRAFVVFDAMDVFYDGLSLSLIGESWETSDREYAAAGFDARYRRKKDKKSATINVGTYFSLYKYDYYFQLGEREAVRTFYVNGKMPLSAALSVRARYEYEDSIENYHSLKIGMGYDF